MPVDLSILLPSLALSYNATPIVSSRPKDSSCGLGMRSLLLCAIRWVNIVISQDLANFLLGQCPIDAISEADGDFCKGPSLGRHCTSTSDMQCLDGEVPEGEQWTNGWQYCTLPLMSVLTSPVTRANCVHQSSPFATDRGCYIKNAVVGGYSLA